MPDSDSESECCHNDFVIECGVRTCLYCGQELGYEISTEKEWRYYGTEDTKHKMNPSRCQYRKSYSRTIHDDIKYLDLTESIVETANDIYVQAINDKIFRSKSRKAVIFACIFMAYKKHGNIISPDSLQEKFPELNKKQISRGMKYIRLHYNSPDIANIHIKPIDLIPDIMKKLHTDMSSITEVKKIYEKIQDKTSLLNRSRPMSIAAGLIFYYIKTNNKKISLKRFSSIVKLSELTITRVSTEIADVFKEKGVEDDSNLADEQSQTVEM